MRESILLEKSERLKFKAEDKALALQEKRLKEKEQLEILQKSLREKQIKAEILRDTQLKSKIERRYLYFRESRLIFSPQRRSAQASLSPVAGAANPAALDVWDTARMRRTLQEEERALKIKNDAKLKHEQAEERALERERARKSELLRGRKEKTKRIEKFQIVKQADEAEKVIVGDLLIFKFCSNGNWLKRLSKRANAARKFSKWSRNEPLWPTSKQNK